MKRSTIYVLGREERMMSFDLIKVVYEILLSLLTTCKFTDIYDQQVDNKCHFECLCARLHFFHKVSQSEFVPS